MVFPLGKYVISSLTTIRESFLKGGASIHAILRQVEAKGGLKGCFPQEIIDWWYSGIYIYICIYYVYVYVYIYIYTYGGSF